MLTSMLSTVFGVLPCLEVAGLMTVTEVEKGGTEKICKGDARAVRRKVIGYWGSGAGLDISLLFVFNECIVCRVFG